MTLPFCQTLEFWLWGTEKELSEWGNVKLQALLDHYGEVKEHTYINEDGERVTTTSPAMVNRDACMNEWIKAKMTVKQQDYKTESIQCVMEMLQRHHSNDYPNLLKLAGCICHYLPPADSWLWTGIQRSK